PVPVKPPPQALRSTRMGNRLLWLASALVVTLVLAGSVGAQPRGKGKGPPGPPRGRVGPGKGLEGALDELRLSGAKKDAAAAAVKAHQDTVRSLTELARAALLLKMKETLSEDEFKKFKAAADRPQPAGPRRGGSRLTADDIVERILSFDKNKDGKVTKDE